MLCDETTHRLKAVIEALRMNPDRYAVIYDSKYDRDDSVSIYQYGISMVNDISIYQYINSSSTTTAPILSSSSTYSISPTPCYHSIFNIILL
jgi:hypothetical protein